MWILPLLGVLGFAGYTSFKNKGGVAGLSEKAARGAIQGAKDEALSMAKDLKKDAFKQVASIKKSALKEASSLKKEAVSEARKVYHVALSAGKTPAHAVNAAVLAVKKLFD